VNPAIAVHATAIAALCAKHHVRRLDVFGSAAGGAFEPLHSDVDFLVEFDELSPEQYFEHFFDLQEDLAALLDRPVDLVVERAVRNPHFLESVQRTRESVLAA
jgi:predicted nucleotidyltransferase